MHGLKLLLPKNVKNKTNRQEVGDLLDHLRTLRWEAITLAQRGAKTHALVEIVTGWRTGSDWVRTSRNVVFRGGEQDWPAEMQFMAHNVKEGGTK
jgi:hypothetical protein